MDSPESRAISYRPVYYAALCLRVRYDADNGCSTLLTALGGCRTASTAPLRAHITRILRPLTGPNPNCAPFFSFFLCVCVCVSCTPYASKTQDAMHGQMSGCQQQAISALWSTWPHANTTYQHRLLCCPPPYSRDRRHANASTCKTFGDPQSRTRKTRPGGLRYLLMVLHVPCILRIA